MRGGNALLFVLALAVAVGVGYGFRERARATSQMRAVGEAYLEHVRADRMGEAWALLSTVPRGAHPPGALARDLQSPALRAAEGVTVGSGRASSPPGTGCLHATLQGAAPDDALTVYLLHEGGDWRVRDVQLYAGDVARGPFACP